MKLLSSSSVSTTSSNANYTSKVSCISGMLRRLLCSNSLPTHPSDHISLSTTYHYCDRTKEAEADGLSLKPPGVVARLMGLESMPPFSLDHAKASNTRPISRSRSMNSVDLLREIKGRNPPTYLELEDENFFILSFESREIMSKQRKNNFAETKQRRKEKLNNKVILMHKAPQKFTVLKDSTNVLRPTDKFLQSISVGMEDYEGAKITRKKKKKKRESFAVEKTLTQSDSEKSSPNSVLYFAETQNSEKFFRLTSSRSRRTLTEELENYRKLKLTAGDNNGVEAKKSERICAESWKKEYKHSENCVQIWSGFSILADRETVERNWLQKEICNFEYCKEIVGGIGLKILDQLLEELVDQLVEQPL
ncbi:PREDICTED: uncharacterized protein LOC109213819 [Nicotiana attenuata]|uniref:DUF3741 domain-containing protein n=1 Tax=Nicotiana attenuata TaxID=49451 RepID=A0A1J6KBT2_NICAT|nr:PREDICTED: uncharacterized protein LOC109213819 [Nicotiana attenuata]OIT27530.1 hypothetical protein A4A49_21507 [Nicotiana attenuata]